jgi:hypothetical protein
MGIGLIFVFLISCLNNVFATNDNINIPDPTNLIKFKSIHTWTNNELYYYFKYCYHVNSTNLYQYLIFNAYNDGGLVSNATDSWVTSIGGKFLNDLNTDECLHVNVINNSLLNNSLEKFDSFYKNNSNKPKFEELLTNESLYNGSLMVYNVPEFKVEGIKPPENTYPELNVTIPPLTFDKLPEFNIPDLKIGDLDIPDFQIPSIPSIVNPAKDDVNIPDLSEYLKLLIKNNLGLFLLFIIGIILLVLIIRAVIIYLFKKIIKYMKKKVDKS